MLRQFADIVPDGAERIYRQFELEAEHRRAQEKREQNFKINSTHIGQGLAAAFVMGVLLLIFLIAKDSPTVAAVLAGGTIVSGIVAFLRVRSGE